MFKLAFIIAVVGTIFCGTVQADPPRWGTLQDEMGYDTNGSGTPWKRGVIPEGATPTAIYHANKMWCRDTRLEMEKNINSELGYLYNNIVDHNPTGRFLHTDVVAVHYQLTLWYTQQAQPVWEKTIRNPRVMYQQCEALASAHLNKVKTVIRMFDEGQNKFQR